MKLGNSKRKDGKKSNDALDNVRAVAGDTLGTAKDTAVKAVDEAKAAFAAAWGRDGIQEIDRDPVDEYDWKALHKPWSGASMMSPVWVAVAVLVVSGAILVSFLFRPMW